MSVFDTLQERATGLSRPAELPRIPFVVEMYKQRTGTPPLGLGFYTREEYELSINVAARFWCNPAEHDESRKYAEMRLASLLYADVITALGDIRHAVMDGDRKSAVTRLNELEARLRK